MLGLIKGQTQRNGRNKLIEPLARLAFAEIMPLVEEF